MRVLLVGTPGDRARLRAELTRASITVLGEFSSMAAARASDLDHDAIIVGGGGAPAADDEIVEPLTSREVQVLELLAEGLPNKAIAARLGISDQTVKFHVSAICGKLGAANRTDAVRRAVRRGLITL
jgi:DNA-binding NarL/FixJ family response regulator